MQSETGNVPRFLRFLIGRSANQVVLSMAEPLSKTCDLRSEGKASHSKPELGQKQTNKYESRSSHSALEFLPTFLITPCT
jgi:hypothetical protein